MTRFIVSFIIVALMALPQVAAAATKAQEATALYQQLMSFKSDRKFHEVGFGVCCKYSSWLNSVRDLQSKSGIDDFRSMGFVPGDLEMLGLEYLKSRGAETSYTKSMNSTIKAGLAPEPKINSGQLKVNRSDRAYISMELTRDHFKAIEEGRYSDATSLLSNDTNCPRVMEKTVVKGPLKRDKVVSSKGSELEYLQVQIPDGRKVWMMEGEVSE